MRSFWNLVSAENTKLWKRFSTKLIVLILAAVIIGICGLQKASISIYRNAQKNSSSNSQSEKMDWKQKLQVENAQLEAEIKVQENSKTLTEKTTLDSNKKQLAENKYHIEHNFKPSDDNYSDFWYLMSTIGVWSLVALFAIIACTALVAGEFSEGTMKTMICRPFARWQILTAKFIVILGYTVVLTIVSYLASLASMAMFFSSGTSYNDILLWIGGKAVRMPGFAASLLTLFMGFLASLVYVIFTFALSAVTRSRALATGLAIFLMFGGSYTQLLAYHFSWGKYIFFADTSFPTFLTNGAPFYGITLSLALVICAVYCIAFFFAGYFTFAKRDIS